MQGLWTLGTTLAAQPAVGPRTMIELFLAKYILLCLIAAFSVCIVLLAWSLYKGGK